MIYKHVLVAVDGSDTSILALQEAIKITKDQNAKLRIILVVDTGCLFANDAHTDYNKFWSLWMNEGQKILDKMAELVRKAQIECESHLIENDPQGGTRIGEKIVEEAIKWSADLLVIGTHGRRGLSHLFLGSVAEHVIRIAPMPVLLVRGKSK